MNENTFSWKTTSLGMKTSLVDKSNNLYAFMPGGQPMNAQGLARGSNFFFCGLTE